MPGRSWRASEEYAARLLEDLGFKILEFHAPVVVDGVEVSEVDIVAEKDGVKYAVEVKAGSLDVSGVRQAYVNALLMGAKPLVIARGADEASKAVAGKLGVEIILLPDILVAGFDELREAVSEAVEAALFEILIHLSRCGEVGDDDFKILRAIAGSETFTRAADTLGVDPRRLGQLLAELRRKGILPHGPYRRVRLMAMIMVACISMTRRGRVD